MIKQEIKTKRYNEIIQESKVQHRIIQDKQVLIDNQTEKMIEMKKVSDAADRVSNTNKHLVVRKCALEAQNKQKDY